MHMLVLPIGAKVKLNGDDGYEAIVQAISIRSGAAVEYEVAWWSGADRRTAWLPEWQLTIGPGVRRQKIGFKQ